MLKKKQTAAKVDKDWFAFAIPLSMVVSHDYMALRLLYYLEPLSTSLAILSKMLDVAEKSLKLFVTVMEQSPNALTTVRENYGHNIDKLRTQAATFNSAFNDPDILSFSADLNDKSGKLYQFIRYGSEITSEGYSAKLGQLLPVIDKIFFESLLGMREQHRSLFVMSSPLKFLLERSPVDQTKNPELLVQALRHSNAYFESFSEISFQLDAEHKQMISGGGGTGGQA